MIEDICNRSNKIKQGLRDDGRGLRGNFWRAEAWQACSSLLQSSVSFALQGLRLTRNPKAWCPTDQLLQKKAGWQKVERPQEERCLVGIHSMTEIKVQSRGSV